MWPISILNWSLFGQLPRGPFFTLFGWPKPWELSLIVLGRSVGGPNCGSFCLIGQNSGSYRLYKPKTMGAIAQNGPPEAKIPKWLLGTLWRLILSISGLCSRNGSQEASGGSFWAFLGPAPELALRKPLEADFEYFQVLLPKWLSGSLWRYVTQESAPTKDLNQSNDPYISQLINQ